MSHATPGGSIWRRLLDRNAEWLRGQYATGEAAGPARRLAHLWARVFAVGLQPRRWVTLEVVGRKSGQRRQFPLGLADRDGRWYAVSMLGECAWTRNVRAASGRVALVRRRRFPVTLVEVPVAERPPIVKTYLTQVPGGRPHIPVDFREPVEAFEAVAATIPVFVVEGDLPAPRG